MFPASFLDDQEKKELLRELRKAFGMEDKVFSVMIIIMLFMVMVIMFLMRLPMKELPMMKGSLENSKFLSSLSSVSFTIGRHGYDSITNHHVCQMINLGTG